MIYGDEDMFVEDEEYYCSYCGIGLTLEEYIEHDFGVCVYDDDDDCEEEDCE